jgi:glycine reductase
MALTLHKHYVRSLGPGPETALRDGNLCVAAEALAAELRSRDPRITDLRVDTANPGESLRIVCVKDVIEPRAKPEPAEPGQGTTRILSGAAVLTCGPIVGFQEGIIDMSGPGADYTPFSSLHVIVLQVDVIQGLSQHEHEAVLRTAGLRAAEYLCARCDPGEPDASDVLSWGEGDVDPQLPRIAYLDMLLSQGLLHDTYVLGRNAQQLLPQIIDPRIAIDNGVVSGNCVSACDKNTTYHHQNNPVINELMRGHGKTWNFVGMVLTNEPTRLADKQESAKQAVALIRQLEAQGAVVSKEGFGNPDADLMMIIRGLEAAGIESVAITDEYAGVDGSSQSLADTAVEADALVSVGNANERLVLPAMDKILGPLPDVARLAGGYPHSLREDGTMGVELQAIIGATNQLGFGRLSCREL